MMKRCIVDSDASDIRQTPRAATDMFTSCQSKYLEPRIHPLLSDLRFYKAVNPIKSTQLTG